MGNPFVHIELQTQDIEQAKKFYGALLDWKLNDRPVAGFGTYTMVDQGTATTGAGMMKSPMPGAPPFWLSYIAVNDVAATADKAQKLGAKLLQPATSVEGWGSFAVIQDPTGAVVGICNIRR